MPKWLKRRLIRGLTKPENASIVSGARWMVSGRVQGVGFRWFVRREAEELGVTGWVRNLPDGRVEVAATGAPPALRTLERRLERGPQFSHVESVERIENMVDVSDYKSFKII